MFAEEWPLMTFTILSQLAVGTFILLLSIDFFRRKVEGRLRSKAIMNGLLAVFLVTGLSLLFSLFHLGTPMGAYRTIGNFSSSWLSREIVFSGAFFFMTLVSLYAYKKETKSFYLLGGITAILGLMVVYSMASLYSASIRPAWDHLNTYITFYGATLLLGIVGAALFIPAKPEDEMAVDLKRSLLKKGWLLAAIVVAIQLVYLPIYMSSLSQGGMEAQVSLQILTEDYGLLLGLKWLLSIAGTGLLIYAFTKQRNKIQAATGSLLITAFIVVFAGEALGRYIFYATGVSIGIG